MKKRILSFLCALALAAALLPAPRAKAAGRVVNVYNWGQYISDGTDGYLDINAAFEEAKATKGKPTVIIANTVKGCGSPVMENKAAWHHKVPTAEEYAQIMADLKAREEAARHE